MAGRVPVPCPLESGHRGRGKRRRGRPWCGRLRPYRLLMLLLLMVAAAVPASAVDLRDVLADYTLTSWSRKDGLTGPVWAITQDAAGFLWLGNDEGLVRFDGVRFVSWDSLGQTPLPHAPVRSLRIAHDDALWAGFGGEGGVARIALGRVRLFHPGADGAPPT